MLGQKAAEVGSSYVSGSASMSSVQAYCSATRLSEYEDVEEQKTPSDMEDQAAQKRLQERLSDFEPKNAIYLKKSRTRYIMSHCLSLTP